MKLVLELDERQWAKWQKHELPLTLPVDEVEARYGDETDARAVAAIMPISIYEKFDYGLDGVAVNVWTKPTKED